MSKDTLKFLIDIIDDNDVEAAFKALIRFVPAGVPSPDVEDIIEKANKSIAKFGAIPHETIDWD